MCCSRMKTSSSAVLVFSSLNTADFLWLGEDTSCRILHSSFLVSFYSVIFIKTLINALHMATHYYSLKR